MDPIFTPWDDPTFVAVYEYPVVRDAHGGYQPSLFASWTVSKNLLTWTFKLQPNLVWSDGEKLTAEDRTLDLTRPPEENVTSPVPTFAACPTIVTMGLASPRPNSLAR